MWQKAISLAYYTLTSLHVGSGRGIRVDLTVQRDVFGVPIIYATSIKGTLKSLFRRQGSEVWRLLGDEIQPIMEPRQESSVQNRRGENCVVFTDAFPLAFPVQHEKCIVYYVTSPYLLRRVYDVLEICQHTGKETLRRIISEFESRAGSNDTAIPLKITEVTRRVSFIPVSSEKIVKVDHEKALNIDLPECFARNAPYPAVKLAELLIIVSDENLLRMLQTVLLTITRVTLRYETKTVREGALWTEEYVPAGTIFIGAMLMRETDSEFETMLRQLEDIFRRGLKVFIGGKETIGKGLVEIVTLS